MNLLGGGSGMFDEEKIKTLNELEMAVYKSTLSSILKRSIN